MQLHLDRLKHFIAYYALILAIPSIGEAKPFDCQSSNCGVVADAPDINFVVGEIDGIATKQSAAAIFSDLRGAGFWKLFPNDAKEFASRISLVSIRISSSRSITVLASYDEVRLSKFKIGDLVRFAPHRGLHEKPRLNDPYWVGIGCVMLLCNVTDNECFSYYSPGIYRFSDGAQMTISSNSLILKQHGLIIDEMTMEPKNRQ